MTDRHRQFKTGMRLQEGVMRLVVRAIGPTKYYDETPVEISIIHKENEPDPTVFIGYYGNIWTGKNARKLLDMNNLKTLNIKVRKLSACENPLYEMFLDIHNLLADKGFRTEQFNIYNESSMRRSYSVRTDEVMRELKNSEESSSNEDK